MVDFGAQKHISSLIGSALVSSTPSPNTHKVTLSLFLSQTNSEELSVSFSNRSFLCATMASSLATASAVTKAATPTHSNDANFKHCPISSLSFPLSRKPSLRFVASKVTILRSFSVHFVCVCVSRVDLEMLRLNLRHLCLKDFRDILEILAGCKWFFVYTRESSLLMISERGIEVEMFQENKETELRN